MIAYFIIVGKESYLFRVGKYAAATAVIVVLAYGASAAAEIVCAQIIAEKLASSMSPDSTDIFAMLNVMNETAIYSNVMSVVGTVAEIASFGSVIAFHKLAREKGFAERERMARTYRTRCCGSGSAENPDLADIFIDSI